MPSLPPSGHRRLDNALFGFSRGLAWSFVALPLTGCSPDSLEDTDLDVVITVRDPGRSYATYQTYALPDTVIDVCAVTGSGAGGAAGAAGAASETDCQHLNHDHDDAILASIRDNLNQLGFSEVEPDEDPDVMILAAAVAQESWYAYNQYCDYWYGYCFEYTWATTAVSYPLGTLAMYMVAWRDADDVAGRVPAVWLGVVSGLLSGSHELDEDRIETGIDQAFAQSRYLGEGK